MFEDSLEEKFSMFDIDDYGVKVITEQTLVKPGINSINAILESSDGALKSFNGEKEENDAKDKIVEGIGENGAVKATNDLGEDYQKKEESASLSDKEVSSDGTDQFVDARSSTQFDGASGDGTTEISDEIKVQMGEIEDEKGYEYDKEVSL